MTASVPPDREAVCEVCDHEFRAHDRSQGCQAVVAHFVWGPMRCGCYNALPARGVQQPDEKEHTDGQ